MRPSGPVCRRAGMLPPRGEDTDRNGVAAGAAPFLPMRLWFDPFRDLGD